MLQHGFTRVGGGDVTTVKENVCFLAKRIGPGIKRGIKLIDIICRDADVTDIYLSVTTVRNNVDCIDITAIFENGRDLVNAVAFEVVNLEVAIAAVG